MKIRFNNDEIALIIKGLDLVQDEREHELGILIRATSGPNPERVNESRRIYERKKTDFGVAITTLQSKIMKLKK